MRGIAQFPQNLTPAGFSNAQAGHLRKTTWLFSPEPGAAARVEGATVRWRLRSAALPAELRALASGVAERGVAVDDVVGWIMRQAAERAGGNLNRGRQAGRFVQKRPGLPDYTGYGSQNGNMLLLLMRIIARRTLREFVESKKGRKDHAGLKAAVDAWSDEVKKARWMSTASVKELYATASVVNAERIVFDIKGNDYRLVAHLQYAEGVVMIRFFGSHEEYDKVDADTI